LYYKIDSNNCSSSLFVQILNLAPPSYLLHKLDHGDLFTFVDRCSVESA